jgi:uncharacterized surface protein with fasciclin (FAS1) repeats
MKKNFLLKKIAGCLLICSLVISVTSCSDDDENSTPAPQSITAIAAANPDFSTLVTALTRTNLATTLDGSGQFTVFAPTNAAFTTFFASLGPNVTVNNVDVAVLKSILLNHVLGTEVKSAAIATGYASTLSPFGTAANGPTISMYIQKEAGIVTVNGGIGTNEAPRKGAVVTTADVDASNGVIHIVNRVIQIPNVVDHAKANPNFSTLTSLLVAQNLVSTLEGTASSPFTVFAPVNTAFDAATLSLYGGLSSANKTAVLTYHVVAGVNVRSNAIPTGNITTLQGQAFSITGTAINDAGTTVDKNIIVTDVQCSNGIVHAIDKVLLPVL